MKIENKEIIIKYYQQTSIFEESAIDTHMWVNLWYGQTQKSLRRMREKVKMSKFSILIESTARIMSENCL